MHKRIVVWVQHMADRPHLVLQWHDPATGKRKSKSAGTCNPLQAEERRADLEYELNHNLHHEASQISWERFRELFEAEYVAPLRANTRRNFATTLDAFEEICTPKRLAGINERTVSQFAAGLRGTPGRARGSTGMQPSTVKVHLQFLRAALSWAVGQGLLAKRPKFPAVKVPAKAPQPVPLEGFERMLEKAPDPQLRCYLLCAWLAGLRLTEALSLEWEQADKAPWVDLANDRIHLPADVVKAGRDQYVPLDPALREALLSLPRHGRKVFRFVGRSGQTLSAGSVSLRVRALAKAAGVRLTMRALRRGFGCRYAGKVSAHVLQRLMRHADIKTTLDYYVNIDAAVDEAVLGPRRNATRNGDTFRPPETAPADDVTPSRQTPS